jgi:hypothetical protein
MDRHPAPIDASPTKQFFVQSLVKDVVLAEAVFDLVDNSIDGYIRAGTQGLRSVSLTISADKFCIQDDCGGIRKEDVESFVLRFGGRPPAPRVATRTIGAFGIGLKRSIYKLGQHILLESDDGSREYAVLIDRQWMASENWRLPFTKDVASKGRVYTRITVEDLYPDVSRQFSTREFENSMALQARKTYCAFLDTKIHLLINDAPVHPLDFRFLCDRKRHFQPMRKLMTFDGVDVAILAGNTDYGRDPDRLCGWNVFCNDRLVVTGDTTFKTGWAGLSEMNFHYPQDAYFLGLVFFGCDDPSKLPWDTAKTGVQTDSAVYRSAQVEMQVATARFVRTCRDAYALKDRETGETIGRALFEGAEACSYREMNTETPGDVPIVDGVRVDDKEIPLPEVANVLYVVPLDYARRVKKKLGDAHMSHKEMGLRTLRYFAKLHGVSDE